MHNHLRHRIWARTLRPRQVRRGHGHLPASLQAGDKVQVLVRPSSKALFRLPPSTDTLLLMFCSGTVLAPFRGFNQQRAIQQSANPSRPLAPAHLFVGCRSQTRDRLYAAEIDAWQAQGGRGRCEVRLHPGERKFGGLCIRAGAVVEKLEGCGGAVGEGCEGLCGSGGFVKEVGHAAREIVQERQKAKGTALSEGALEAFIKEQMADRCAADVFG
jgi:cytochrome P450/NADPH-cytochrome P450 reductase